MTASSVVTFDAVEEGVVVIPTVVVVPVTVLRHTKLLSAICNR